MLFEQNPNYFIVKIQACWSPDGRHVYVGRRKGKSKAELPSVDEFDILEQRNTRNIKFPEMSGAVSAVAAMPNGKHLVWYVFSFLFYFEVPKTRYSNVAPIPLLLVRALIALGYTIYEKRMKPVTILHYHQKVYESENFLKREWRWIIRGLNRVDRMLCHLLSYRVKVGR